MKKLLSVLLVALVIGVSCQNETLNSLENQIKTELTSNKGTKSSSMTNYRSANPFDFVGEEHNEYLTNFYIQEYSPKPTAKGMEVFLKEIGFNGFQEIYPLRELAIDRTLSVDSYIDQNNYFSLAVKSYAHEIIAMIGDDNALDELVLAVLNDRNLKQFEKEALLQSIAVAKHSAHYWVENLENWISGGEPVWPMQNYVAIDASAALGIAMSCSLGLATPPTGMTVAAFAAAGGATASIAAAIVDGVTFVVGEVGNNTGWW